MMGFHAFSERILIVKIASKPFNLVIVQVYAPKSTSPEDIEKFYDDLDVAYRCVEVKKSRSLRAILMQKLEQNKTAFGK